MNTDATLQISSTSSDKTEEIGERLGTKLRGGEVIELISDLGGGKTAFTRGLARGMGSSDHVASPTFTLSREYRSGRLTMYHFDFYRLEEPGIMEIELAEAISDPLGITVVEWGSIVESVLPDRRMTIAITRTGESTRELTYKYPNELQYLVREEQ